jgi:hypothetical protein
MKIKLFLTFILLSNSVVTFCSSNTSQISISKFENNTTEKTFNINTRAGIVSALGEMQGMLDSSICKEACGKIIELFSQNNVKPMQVLVTMLSIKNLVKNGSGSLAKLNQELIISFMQLLNRLHGDIEKFINLFKNVAAEKIYMIKANLMATFINSLS